MPQIGTFKATSTCIARLLCERRGIWRNNVSTDSSGLPGHIFMSLEKEASQQRYFLGNPYHSSEAEDVFVELEPLAQLHIRLDPSYVPSLQIDTDRMLSTTSTAIRGSRCSNQ